MLALVVQQDAPCSSHTQSITASLAIARMLYIRYFLTQNFRFRIDFLNFVNIESNWDDNYKKSYALTVLNQWNETFFISPICTCTKDIG